jgi:hypothetical protein
VLLLETMVCDSAIPLMLLEDETKAASQALDGLGCRPSPPFVALALSRVGFRHVYGTIAPPAHADFQFEWRNSLDVRRDGHSLRSMFVASDAQVPDPTLVSLLDG